MSHIIYLEKVKKQNIVAYKPLFNLNHTLILKGIKPLCFPVSLRDNPPPIVQRTYWLCVPSEQLVY